MNLRSQTPLLDIASHGRRGPSQGRLTPAQIAHAGRTVRGVPEVMIKVSGGARTVGGVGKHLAYLEKRADLETDEGITLAEKGRGPDLLKDWNLELDEDLPQRRRAIAAGRKPPKLVHNIVFSMPKGTPADKLHKAVKRFAMEKFALQHRYAMALHTDQANPHVHLVVNARSEYGDRLNIYKATLREWRQDFARLLRELGVEANATERAVRGAQRHNFKDGIYRAATRGDSSFMRERAQAVARELREGAVNPGIGKARLMQTRRDVEHGWRVFADAIAGQGMHLLADQVRQFVDRMPRVQTHREWIGERIRKAAHERAPPTR